MANEKALEQTHARSCRFVIMIAMEHSTKKVTNITAAGTCI